MASVCYLLHSLSGIFFGWLTVSQLERAVRSFSKPQSEIKEFSNEFWGSKVNVYHSSLRAIDEKRWEEIFELCGAGDTLDPGLENDALEADLSLLDNNRAFLFDFASPAKHGA